MSTEANKQAETPSQSLARTCLTDFENQQLQEVLIAGNESFERARSFYAEDCPGKVLLPTSHVEEYRRKARETHYYFGVGDMTPEVNEVEAWVAADMAQHPTREAFPWLHYSRLADGYLVDALELDKVFDADLMLSYPDQIEREPDAGQTALKQSVDERRQILAHKHGGIA